MTMPSADALRDDRALQALLDGELALPEQLALEARLAADPALARRHADLRALQRSLRVDAEYHRVPDALRQRLRAGAWPAAGAIPPGGQRQEGGVSRPVTTPVGGATGVSAGWLPAWAARPVPLGGVVLVAALLLAGGLGGWPWWQARQHESRLRDEVVAGHVRATLSQRLVDVVSSDRHTVKPWLAGRLDFSPPVVQPLAVAGEAGEGPGEGATALVGARVDYLDGHVVAALVYRRGAHVVNVFVWPDAGDDAPPRLASDRGWHLARWRREGMVHWAVSDVAAPDFARLLRTLGAPAGS